MRQRVGILGALKKLIAGAPAAIAALDNIYPARWVATVGIVVTRKKVSELIEGQPLGIAQADGE